MTKRTLRGCEICEGNVAASLWPPPDRLARSRDGYTALHWCPACNAYWEFTMDDERLIELEEAIELFPWVFGEGRSNEAASQEGASAPRAPRGSAGSKSTPAARTTAGTSDARREYRRMHQQQLLFGEDHDSASLPRELEALRERVSTLEAGLQKVTKGHEQLMNAFGGQGRQLDQISKWLMQSGKWPGQKPS
jgi:hypothetical protein